MTFGPAFTALQSEGYLAQGCLSTGLTALRTARFPDKAAFYTGFFQTSIALERVLKLVLIVQRMRNHQFQPPSKTEIKQYEHDLIRLYSGCVPVAQSIHFARFSIPASGSIESSILAFLSEFATKSRYYNLDSLATSPSGYVDPLAAWDRILTQVLISDVPSDKRDKRIAEARAVHALLEDSISVIQHGMDGKRLSTEAAFIVPAEHEVAVPYVMVRIFNVISPAIVLLGELCRVAFDENLSSDRAVHHIPLMHEFFGHFQGTSAEIRSKRRWP